jgi:hypothetical protein
VGVTLRRRHTQSCLCLSLFCFTHDYVGICTVSIFPCSISSTRSFRSTRLRSKKVAQWESCVRWPLALHLNESICVTFFLQDQPCIIPCPPTRYSATEPNEAYGYHAFLPTEKDHHFARTSTLTCQIDFYRFLRRREWSAVMCQRLPSPNCTSREVGSN